MQNVSPERLKLFAVSALIIVLFFPSRLLLLYNAKPAGTDTELYARYAYIHRLAAECHLSFYDCYRTMGLADISGPGPKTFDSLAMTVVAYPPFAVAMMSVPGFFIQGGGAPVSRMSMPEFTVRYKKAYPWLCAAAELIMVMIVSFLVLRLYKDERLVITVLRMGLLCLAGMCMPRILYNRLDVLLSALLMVSLAAMIRKKPFLLFSFFVFALAVNFKLIPLFLLPVWLLGSLRQQPDRHLLKAIIPKGFQLCGIVAGTTFFFFLLEGKGVFDFVAFHLDRGIHIESTWGVLSLFAAKVAGTPFRMALSSGAYNVYTQAAGLLSVLSSATLFIAMLAVTAVFTVRCLKKSANAETRAALMGLAGGHRGNASLPAYRFFMCKNILSAIPDCIDAACGPSATEGHGRFRFFLCLHRDLLSHDDHLSALLYKSDYSRADAVRTFPPDCPYAAALWNDRFPFRQDVRFRRRRPPRPQ